MVIISFLVYTNVCRLKYQDPWLLDPCWLIAPRHVIYARSLVKLSFVSTLHTMNCLSSYLKTKTRVFPWLYILKLFYFLFNVEFYRVKLGARKIADWGKRCYLSYMLAVYFLMRAPRWKMQMVIDFTASWCGPCRFIAPFLAELAKKLPDVIFVKVDVDELKVRNISKTNWRHLFPKERIWFRICTR